MKKIFEEIYQIPAKPEEVCMNCLDILPKKLPKKKYVFTNQRGNFCSEKCAEQFEQNID